MNELSYIQIFGYAASAVIALSMAQSSIVKFRWINLAGATMFSTYGFVLGAYPVGVLNGFIMLVDLYYLKKIYFKKDNFDTLEIRKDNRYLIKFLEFHKQEIEKYFPGFDYKPDMNTISFFVLRNTAVAGIFLAHEEDNQTLRIGLDYAVPEYRDYKNGKFVYQSMEKSLKEKGIKRILARGDTKKHINYLKKCGFKKSENNIFQKSLV
jgi:hypothetical protein